MRLDGYDTGGFHDEMFDAAGNPAPRRSSSSTRSARSRRASCCAASRRPSAAPLSWASPSTSTATPPARSGFSRSTSFPRIVRADEWDWIERGLKQRIHALNQFIDDIYHEQQIHQGRHHPRGVITSAAFYRPQCVGINPP